MPCHEVDWVTIEWNLFPIMPIFGNNLPFCSQNSLFYSVKILHKLGSSPSQPTVFRVGLKALDPHKQRLGGLLVFMGKSGII
jgi:hypothetical protein